MVIPNELRYKLGDDQNILLRKILETLLLIVGNGTISMIDNPVAVTTVSQVSVVDKSGTIAAANTSQVVAAANPSRTYFVFQNVSDKVMWLNFGGVATLTQPSLQINPGGSITLDGPTVVSDSVNVIGPNTGKAFTAKEG
jgi:hypothetical protein